MDKHGRKNPWGQDIYECFDGDRITSTGTAYYYGIDGEHAVYEVTAMDEGTLIVNGDATTVKSAKEAFQMCREKHIDLSSGWSKRP